MKSGYIKFIFFHLYKTSGTSFSLFLIFFILSFTSIKAESGFDFLKISPSPVASSLGDACSSSYMINPSSFYYNPALLTFNFPVYTQITPSFKSMDFYFSYIKYIEDMNYFSFFSVLDIKPIKRIGIGFTGLFNNDIISSSYEGESYAVGSGSSASFYSFLIGYGVNVTKEIGTGINIKLPVENLGSQSSIGIGADVGGIYKQKNWNASLVVQNIGMDIKSVENSHNLPMTVKIGGGYDFHLSKKKPEIHIITITADIGKEIEKDFIGGAGIQYSYNNMIFLRNGYNIKKDNFNIKFGGGIHYRNYQLDYGFNWKDMGNIHRIGFGMKFDLEKGIETEQTKNGIMIRISEKDAILFKYNKANLRKDAHKTLDKVVNILKKHKDKDILICGHTDNTGRKKYNLNLSKKRAKAVYNYFIKKGIKRKRMKSNGYGETKPIASNKIAKGRARNRRVDIILLRLSKKEQEKFDEHYYEGMDCYIKEGYKRAIAAWEKALKIDPENEDVKNWIEKAEKEMEKKRKSIKKRGGINNE